MFRGPEASTACAFRILNGTAYLVRVMDRTCPLGGNADEAEVVPERPVAASPEGGTEEPDLLRGERERRREPPCGQHGASPRPRTSILRACGRRVYCPVKGVKGGPPILRRA